MRTEDELRREVYRRSVRKDIGVLDAIRELLAETVAPEVRREVDGLRAVMRAYHRRRPLHP